jgi:hypothetical protein
MNKTFVTSCLSKYGIIKVVRSNFILTDEEIMCVCFLHLSVVSEDTSKAICRDGIIQSPILSIAPQETALWETKITLLGRGYFEVGVIIQETTKGDDTGLGRRWSSDPYYVKSRVS